MNQAEKIKRLEQLRREKNAIIVAHYYANPEVQDVADYIGDSLGLSQIAERSEADIILFAGMKFMAETASIISPGKKVLLPDITTLCTQAESMNKKAIIEWREANPNGLVITHINSTAEVKALSDICCTSANVLKIVDSIPEEIKILLGPDKNVAKYAEAIVERELDVWQGGCTIHKELTSPKIERLIALHPEAEVLIHPESSSSSDLSLLERDNLYIRSTSGIINRVGRSTAKEFIIATEPGVLHQLKTLYPDRKFIMVNTATKCSQMAKITIDKLIKALEREEYLISVPEAIRAKAYPSIERMIFMSTL